jgi:hypothetical protein
MRPILCDVASDLLQVPVMVKVGPREVTGALQADFSPKVLLLVRGVPRQPDADLRV